MATLALASTRTRSGEERSDAAPVSDSQEAQKVTVIYRSGDDLGVELGSVYANPVAKLEAFRATCMAKELPLPGQFAFLSLQGHELTAQEERTRLLREVLDAETQAIWVQAAAAGAPLPAPTPPLVLAAPAPPPPALVPRQAPKSAPHGRGKAPSSMLKVSVPSSLAAPATLRNHSSLEQWQQPPLGHLY